MPLLIPSSCDIEPQLERIREAAAATQARLLRMTGDPLFEMRRMKFDHVGQHPVLGHALNLVEQINQTWTYIAALLATKKLFELHHGQEGIGFHLAPGAHAAQALDIMSVTPGLIGAETFAAVHPANNGKLTRDLQRLARHVAVDHRYIFFVSPAYPKTERQTRLERGGKVEVWSVDIEVQQHNL